MLNNRKPIHTNLCMCINLSVYIHTLHLYDKIYRLYLIIIDRILIIQQKLMLTCSLPNYLSCHVIFKDLVSLIPKLKADQCYSSDISTKAF